jgi:hypothetical protein
LGASTNEVVLWTGTGPIDYHREPKPPYRAGIGGIFARLFIFSMIHMRYSLAIGLKAIKELKTISFIIVFKII